MLMLAYAACYATLVPVDPREQTDASVVFGVVEGQGPTTLTVSHGGAELISLAVREGSQELFTGSVLGHDERGLWSSHLTIHPLGGEGSVVLEGTYRGSDQAFPAETRGAAQERFPLVRNTVGLSDNLRNNAIYDRARDWLFEVTEGQVEIHPLGTRDGQREFRIVLSGAEIAMTFHADYYRLHKGVRFFDPTQRIWPESIAGWCSWWPYRADISEETVARVSRVFAEKLRDYGYEHIQIDDGFQSSNGGRPENWLTTNDRFPSGLAALAETIRKEGLKPGLWVNVHMGDESLVREHPQWFVREADGAPRKGPWIDYGLDATNAEAVDTVVRPLYRALKEQGWDYVKIDTLRHLLYDDYYPCRADLAARGTSPEDAIRSWLRAARAELGPETYILACWGVLPEVAGIVDGCRLGGDGFGPMTLAQYNSWNNIVWRNDPDHVDITPEGSETIRPVLVSMAGAQMLLTDKVEVYEDDRKIEGARRSAPILHTLPGQLYDYDPSKTDALLAGLRNEEGGGPQGPIDADQEGPVPAWWMLEIDRPFERWSVLARLAWQPQDEAHVAFADLGLDPAGRYGVYEFWTRRYVGACEDGFTAAALPENGVAVYAIRELLDRPQVLATSRHITMGGPDLESVAWNEAAHGANLKGRSHVVKGDPYTITVSLPEGWAIDGATGSAPSGRPATHAGYAEVTFSPAATGTMEWEVAFRRM